MIDLCARPQPDPNREVIISQHWPVMPPPSHPRLALSLFAWEETRVPSDIVQTLTNGFDAIISPAQCVTDALSLSGCRLPIDTIGQPVELAPYGHWRASASPLPGRCAASCISRRAFPARAWMSCLPHGPGPLRKR
ncbi:hypothetical protein RAA17_03115 [Komagataeibacter rhaeticus]|nr:hypothetical protein [Komagataeibacter rhaeticus]